MDEKMIFNRRAQVTIFIILAMIIVVAIIILFLLIRKPDLEIEDVENPQAYIESCVRDFTEEAIELLSKQGGDIVPSPKTTYLGEEIAYLCYTGNWYLPCIMQEPGLVEHVEDEITDYIYDRTENCFQSLKSGLEKKNYYIEIGSMEIDTKLKTGEVVVNIQRDFKMTKREEVRSFTEFNVKILSPITSILETASQIANSEAKFCNFDILGYMIYFPQYKLDKVRPSASLKEGIEMGDTIYYILHKPSNKEFKFAIRSCALPPGF